MSIVQQFYDIEKLKLSTKMDEEELVHCLFRRHP